MLNKKQKAFTLFEMLITTLILSILVSLVIPNLYHANFVDKEKLMGHTMNFYQSVENAIISMRSIKQMGDADSDGSLTALDYSSYFLDRITGERLEDCGELLAYYTAATQPAEGETPPTGVTQVTTLTCAQFQHNITAGFFFDPTCKISVAAKEYFELDEEEPQEEGEEETPVITRNVQNACAIIVYVTKDSLKEIEKDRPIIGKNIFIIADGSGVIK